MHISVKLELPLAGHNSKLLFGLFIFLKFAYTNCFGTIKAIKKMSIWVLLNLKRKKKTLFCFVHVYSNGEEIIFMLLITMFSSNLSRSVHLFLYVQCPKQATREKLCRIRGDVFSFLCNRNLPVKVIWRNGDT